MPAHYPPPDHGGRLLRGLRFFIFHRLNPAVPASSPHPGPAHSPPRLFRSRAPRRRENIAPPPATSTPHAIRVTPEPAGKAFPFSARASPSRASPRLLSPPASTKKTPPSPEPPPFIRILNTPHPRHPHSPEEPAGKTPHFLPRLPRPRRPKKRRPAPLSAPTHPPAPGKSTEVQQPHTHPAGHLPAPSEKAPPPAGRLPAPLLAAPAPAPPRAPLPDRHKKSGSPLKAAVLRSNRRAISCP